MADYLGDAGAALARYDALGPGVAAIKIATNDAMPHRYCVVLWNGHGRWEGCKATLADSIHQALDRGVIDRFGFAESKWQELAGRAALRAHTARAAEGSA